MPTGSPPQAGKIWGDLAGHTGTGRGLRVGSPPRAGFFVDNLAGPTGTERGLRVGSPPRAGFFDNLAGPTERGLH